MKNLKILSESEINNSRLEVISNSHLARVQNFYSLIKNFRNIKIVPIIKNLSTIRVRILQQKLWLYFRPVMISGFTGNIFDITKIQLSKLGTTLIREFSTYEKKIYISLSVKIYCHNRNFWGTPLRRLWVLPAICWGKISSLKLKYLL